METPYPVGYQPFGSPNNDDRFLAYPDGSFAIEIHRQDITDTEPFIRTALSLAGDQVLSMNSDQTYVFKTVDGDEAVYSYVIPGPLVKLPVGTLELYVVVNEMEHSKKWITIPDSPFATGGNSDYVNSIDARDTGAFVLQGEYPITGGETGVEIRFYKQFLRAPTWVSVGLYDSGGDPVLGHEVQVTDIQAERAQIEFVPAIPAQTTYTLIWAAWV
jgi:hypothetical protein